MKKSLITLCMLLAAQSVFAFDSSSKNDDENKPEVTEEKKKDQGISSSSGSLYTDVECDMSDYTCYKMILDLGRQEAIGHIIAGGDPTDRSALLNQAIQVYKQVNPAAEIMSDEEIIIQLATSKK